MTVPGVGDLEASSAAFNPRGSLSFSGNSAICSFSVSCMSKWKLMLSAEGEAVISSLDPTQCLSERSLIFNGKVAVIERGDCAFADKVCHAQLQGAIAAIIVNNVDGNSFTMGGSSRCE